MEINVPYNFVPLNQHVFRPPWGKVINHDVPFREGLSGQLTLTIKAETPIFIRGGGQESTPDSPPLEFSNVNGHYFIPGSSIKGMLRNVVEILGFGQLRQFNDDRYGIRDIQNELAYPLKKSNTIHAGWMKPTNDPEHPYCIYDVGVVSRQDDDDSVFRISHQQLGVSPFTHKSFLAIFAKNNDHYSNTEEDQKTALHKYKLYYNCEDALALFQEAHSVKRTPDDVDSNYHLVFTGQPNHNSTKGGKKWEFRFPVLSEEHHKGRLITKQDFDDFKFIYNDKDHDKIDISKDWAFFKERLAAGKEIPVFFSLERESGNDKVAHFGLSMLYKLPYKYRVGQLAGQHTDMDPKAPDLAACIFGYTTGDKALKGRVHIAHAFAQGNPRPMQTVRKVLMGPKPTFYPFYVEQSVNSQGVLLNQQGYKTMMDEHARIRGYKRYPIHAGFDAALGDADPKLHRNVMTRFKPLPPDTVFKTTVRYHNLLPEELGALLSAITFHNTESCYHNIGMGKPLGFGKVTLDIDPAFTPARRRQYMGRFEAMMDAELGTRWHASPQVKELLSMATPTATNQFLRYMDRDGYTAVKRNPKKALPGYTDWEHGHAVACNSFTSFAEVPYQSNRLLYEQDEETFKIEAFKKIMKDRIKDIEAQVDREEAQARRIQKAAVDAEIEERKRKEEAERLARQVTALKLGVAPLKEVTSLDGLEAKMKIWLRDIWNNKYQSVVSKHKGKVIPDQFLPAFKDIVCAVLRTEKKQKNRDSFKRKLIQWIGETQTNQLFDACVSIKDTLTDKK